jgi:hypothetical protein
MYTGLKYQGETLLDYKYTFFFLNEGQEGKTGLFWGWVPVVEVRDGHKER